jgi:hypothetical protein
LKNTHKRDFIDQTLSPRDFLRTLSYREFFTSFSLAILLAALFRLITYYSNEPWIGNNQFGLRLALYFIVLPINHILYMKEHSRPNNFIGRNFHDYIFTILFATLNVLYASVSKGDYTFQTDNGMFEIVLIGLILAIGFATIEVVITILKRLLNFFGWQVL